MAVILKTKNSVTTTVVPTTLSQGELAVNIADKKMWVGNAATTPVLLFQGNPQYIIEDATVGAVAATGTINFDLVSQSVLYYTSNATANWTVNFRGNSSTTLNTLLEIGQSITCTFLVTQGATAYYNSAVTIDGTSVTPVWQGGTAPTSGNASGLDVYTYAIIKTASATFKVLASQTRFA
jgi:DNA-binding beta-propeller fold protein YncE